MSALISSVPEREIVLSKAFLRVQDKLGLSDDELGGIVGLNRTTLYRRKQKNGIALKEGEKAWELGVLLVRLYRSLYALVGGDADNMRWWFDTDNNQLGGSPRKLIQKTEGLVNVVHYLDAMRGKI